MKLVYIIRKFVKGTLIEDEKFLKCNKADPFLHRKEAEEIAEKLNSRYPDFYYVIEQCPLRNQ